MPVVPKGDGRRPPIERLGRGTGKEKIGSVERFRAVECRLVCGCVRDGTRRPVSPTVEPDRVGQFMQDGATSGFSHLNWRGLSVFGGLQISVAKVWGVSEILGRRPHSKKWLVCFPF